MCRIPRLGSELGMVSSAVERPQELLQPEVRRFITCNGDEGSMDSLLSFNFQEQT